MAYIFDGSEPATTVLWALSLAPGKVRWRATQCGTLVDAHGNRIGSLYRGHGGRGPGWSVWTTPYAGYAAVDEVEIVPCPRGEACEFADMHYTTYKPQEKGGIPS